MESRDALRVFLASSPLIGAFFLDALLRVSYKSGNCSFDSVQTLVVKDTFPKSTGGSVAFLGKAGGPASLIIAAFSFTILESSQTALIFSTCLGLLRAVVSDAIFGSVKNQSLLDSAMTLSYIDAFILDNAIDVVGSVGALGFLETIFPAC